MLDIGRSRAKERGRGRGSGSGNLNRILSLSLLFSCFCCLSALADGRFLKNGEAPRLIESRNDDLDEVAIGESAGEAGGVHSKTLFSAMKVLPWHADCVDVGIGTGSGRRSSTSVSSVGVEDEDRGGIAKSTGATIGLCLLRRRLCFEVEADEGVGSSLRRDEASSQCILCTRRPGRSIVPSLFVRDIGIVVVVVVVVMVGSMVGAAGKSTSRGESGKERNQPNPRHRPL